MLMVVGVVMASGRNGDVYVVQCLFELSRWLQMTKWQFLKGILITSIQFVELQPDWKEFKAR